MIPWQRKNRLEEEWVKKYGKWVTITSAQQQEICKRVNEIKPILEMCPSCKKKLERREL